MSKSKTVSRSKSSSASKKPSLKLSVGDKLSAVTPRLRRGDMSELARRTGYDQSHVSRVLRGIRSNPEIVSAAYKMVGRRRVGA